MTAAGELVDGDGHVWVQPVAGVDAWEMPKYSFDPTFANLRRQDIARCWGIAAEAGAP